MTDDDLRRLMEALVRRDPKNYGDTYWVAYLARFGRNSVYAAPHSRSRAMTQAQALAECEKFVEDGGLHMEEL